MMAKVKPGSGKGSATAIMQSRYCLEIANSECSGLSRDDDVQSQKRQ